MVEARRKSNNTIAGALLVEKDSMHPSQRIYYAVYLTAGQLVKKEDGSVEQRVECCNNCEEQEKGIASTLMASQLCCYWAWFGLVL